MEPGIDFNLVRSQKLLLIPQLKQALDILGMNFQELYDYVEEQMETNPLLEIVTEERQFYTNDMEDGDDNIQADAAATVTLKEYLLLQLDTLDLDRTQQRIGEYLIDNTDENGYLKVQIHEVAAFFNVASTRVHKVMTTLQSFDPPGICARSLKECLKIQLNQMEYVNRDAVLIVEKHLNMLAENDMSTVAAETGLDMANVEEAFKLIRTLEPRPGREFYKNEEIQPVVVDVFIRSIGKKYGVVLNEDAFPEINILEDYKQGKLDKTVGGAAIFLKDKLHGAIWIMKCIEQRKNIILKIAEYILKEQADFFEKGVPYLEKINRKRLEDDLDIHESVLMEALKGKHINCRWGVYDFKYFFY